MRLIMTLIAAVVITVAMMTGIAVLIRPAPPPVPAGLHTIWCVKRGYPPDLAMPVITGPGTGLAGCPLGEVQVSEP